MAICPYGICSDHPANEPACVDCIRDMKRKSLSVDELAALKAFAERHGRNWKSALREAWINASEPGILQQLRNDSNFGPSGLNRLNSRDLTRR